MLREGGALPFFVRQAPRPEPATPDWPGPRLVRSADFCNSRIASAELARAGQASGVFWTEPTGLLPTLGVGEKSLFLRVHKPGCDRKHPGNGRGRSFRTGPSSWNTPAASTGARRCGARSECAACAHRRIGPQPGCHDSREIAPVTHSLFSFPTSLNNLQPHAFRPSCHIVKLEPACNREKSTKTASYRPTVLRISDPQTTAPIQQH
jgi:hypothetical protein